MVSEIFSWLYLGDREDAINKDLIEDLEIAYIINCVSQAWPCPFENVQYYKLYLETITQVLTRYEMKSVVEFIDRAREEKKNVLVHCYEGKDRGPSVVIAYLCEKGMTFEEAYKLIKSKRPMINPRSEMLIEYIKNEY